MGTLLHQHQRLWSTEPLWVWRSVVVAWWLVVAGALVSAVSAIGSLLTR